MVGIGNVQVSGINQQIRDMPSGEVNVKSIACIGVAGLVPVNETKWRASREGTKCIANMTPLILTTSQNPGDLHIYNHIYVTP